MIKLIVNDVELDLKSDTVVALTKKAVDIGNLQNRWSSYTNKFTVPATKKNRDALGIKQFQDASGSQYQYQNGKLVSGGLEIASNVLVIIESVSKDITLTLRAGNGGLFDQLNRTKLSDLDWDDLNHRWWSNQVWLKSVANYNEGYVYPIHQTGGQSNKNNTLIPKATVPFIYVKSAFERIADYFGYTWTGDTYTLDMFEKLTYPITSLKIDSAFANQYIFDSNLDYKNFGTLELLPDRINPLSITATNDPKSKYITKSITIKTGTSSSVTKTVKGYSIPLSAIYEIEFTYNVDYAFYNLGVQSGLGIYVFNKVANLTTLYKQINFPISIGGLQNATGTVTFKIDFRNFTVDDDRYVIFVSVFTNDEDTAQFTINSGTFEIKSIETEKTNFFADIQIKNAQPDLTCGKFIKEVGNVFGAIYDVDEFKKTIEITRLDEIALNKAYALDWTDKLDLSQQIITTFKTEGFAKSMVLQWKEDLKYTKVVIIDNDQLPEKNEYIKSDAAYCENANILTYPTNVVNIPYWTGSKIQPDGQLRFALVKTENSQVVIFPLTSGPFAHTGYKVAYFDYPSSPYSLDWSNLFDYYYADLLDPMTDRLQVVECYMKLNDLDIQSFRFKYPVYIKHFNRYFFVNEIAEYTGKTQSTKVLLVGI